MINPKFHLQSLKKNGKPVDSPILLLFSVNGKRLQYYTQFRVPQEWHATKAGKYPFKNDMPGAAGIKLKLDALIRHVFTIESDLIKSGAPQTVESYKQELDRRFKGRIDAPVKTETIEDRISEYLSHVKANLAHNTFKNSNANLNHFRTFLGKNATRLSVKEIDETLIANFVNYMKDGRLNNTVVKSAQVVRTFLQYCLKKKYITVMPMVETGSPNNITVIHLSHDEVMRMAMAPMPNLSLERVRDFFLFGCFTGMRYGDIAGLKKVNVYGNHIKFFNEKNGATQAITVPLTPVSKSIIEKYKDIPGAYALPSISNQKTNDALKEVARLAGLTDKIEIANKDAFGSIIKNHYLKYELVSCHTSRKSFITIAMTLGMPESTIVSITGHAKGSKAFHKYYDVVNQTKFTQMAEIFNR